MDQVQSIKNLIDVVYLGRPYHYQFFKGYLPNILLGAILNTLLHIYFELNTWGCVHAFKIKKFLF